MVLAGGMITVYPPEGKGYDNPGSIMASAIPSVSGQGRCPHAREARGVGCPSLYVYRTISIFVA
jgi:hypothetical protein